MSRQHPSGSPPCGHCLAIFFPSPTYERNPRSGFSVKWMPCFSHMVLWVQLVQVLHFEVPLKPIVNHLCVVGGHAMAAVVDYEADAAIGQRTIATTMGKRPAAIFAASCLWASYFILDRTRCNTSTAFSDHSPLIQLGTIPGYLWYWCRCHVSMSPGHIARCEQPPPLDW